MMETAAAVVNAAEIAEMVEALTAIAQVLDRLGIPGVISLIIGGPLITLFAILTIEYQRGRKMHELIENIRSEARRADQTYRSEMRALAETSRAESRTLMETYRSDMSRITRELGQNQTQTDHYYRDSVELVRQYERVAKGMQDVIIANTRAMERLITMLETRRNQP